VRPATTGQKMKIVQVTMVCELPGGDKYTSKLKDCLDGLNRLSLHYQVHMPDDQNHPIRILATGQAGKVESALRLYGAILTEEQWFEVLP
jgi:hypothetical protein